MTSAFDMALGTPWLIHAPALETILEIAARQPVTEEMLRQWKTQRDAPTPSMVEMEVGTPLSDGNRRVQVRNGVAVVTLRGPVFRYANLFTAFSGATALRTFGLDFAEALKAPSVKAILMNVDSPGGDARGIAEMAAAIRNATGTKPVTAYIGGSGASAAYWLSAAAGEVVVSSTSMVGSIGTIIGYRDTRERDAKNGVRDVEFVSSQSPLKRADGSTPEGAKALQALVDRLTDEFVSSVAGYRGVSVETVLSDFGRGGVLIGADAVAADMADRVGTFEETLDRLAQQRRPGVFIAAQAPHSSTSQETTMSQQQTEGTGDGTPTQANTPPVTPQASTTPAAETVEQTTTQPPAAPQPQQQTTAQAPKAAAGDNPVAAERARISAIMDSEHAKDKPALARQLALNTDLAPSACDAILMAAAPETAAEPAKAGAAAFAEAMQAGAPNPALGMGGAAEQPRTAGLRAAIQARVGTTAKA